MFRWSLLFSLVPFLLFARPKDGFLVKTDSVKFKSRDGKISFSGVLTSPKGKRSFPTLVMVSGTGKQDLNGTMAGHRIFEEVAIYLAGHGIAMLRTDDRGVGGTSGTYETSTTADFADDALSAVYYLKSRQGINPKKIGLMGHSEGGMAIAIAASKSTDIHFLISLAGLASSGFDAQIRQNEDLVAASPMPDYDKKRSNEINRLMFETARKYAQSDSLEQKLNDIFNSWKKKDDIYFKSLNKGFDHFRFPIYSYVQNAKGPWYRFFIAYDAKSVISKIKVPILAINGDRDLMVAADENLYHWREYTLIGGNYKVTTLKLPGLNHLLLTCQKCDIAEMASIKTGVSLLALREIKNWIINTVR